MIFGMPRFRSADVPLSPTRRRQNIPFVYNGAVFARTWARGTGMRRGIRTRTPRISVKSYVLRHHHHGFTAPQTSRAPCNEAESATAIVRHPATRQKPATAIVRKLCGGAFRNVAVFVRLENFSARIFAPLAPPLPLPPFPSPPFSRLCRPPFASLGCFIFFRPSPCFLPRRPLLAPFFRRHSLRTHPSYFSYFFRCRNRPDRSSPARKDIPCPRPRHRRGTQCRGGFFVFRSKTGSFFVPPPKKKPQPKNATHAKKLHFPAPSAHLPRRRPPALMPRRQPPAEYETTAKNTRSSAVSADLTSSVREKMRR